MVFLKKTNLFIFVKMLSFKQSIYFAGREASFAGNITPDKQRTIYCLEQTSGFGFCTYGNSNPRRKFQELTLYHIYQDMNLCYLIFYFGMIHIHSELFQ